MDEFTEKEIVDNIKDFIFENGEPDSFYIGVTSNPEKKLFEDHKVDRDNSNEYIYFQCSHHISARSIKEHFIENTKIKGNINKKEESNIFVYVYKISQTTIN